MTDPSDDAAAAYLASLGASTAPSKSKKKKKKKKGGKAAAAADDDWEVLDAAGKAVDGTVEAAAAPEAPPAVPDSVAKPGDIASSDDAAAAYLASMGLNAAADGADNASSTKKKKKKGKKGKKPKEDPKPKKLTGAAKAAQERLARAKAEEERLAKEKADLEAAEAAEEAVRQAEIARIEAERKRKADKRQAAKDRARAEGKAVTKAEKARAAKAKAQREALIAQGFNFDEASNNDGGAKKKVVYGNKKKKNKKQTSKAEQVPTEPEKPAVEEAKPAEPEVPDSWDAGGDDDDDGAAWDADSDDGDAWDVSAQIAKLKAAAPSPAEESDEEVEEVVEDIIHHVPSPKCSSKAASKGKGGKKAAVEETETSVGAESEASGAPRRNMTREEREAEKARKLEEKRAAATERREARLREALKKRSKDDLRSPICCVLGHVDTGKTKLLDKIRKTNVQDQEAGGITQQIGATYFPMEKLKISTDKLNKDLNLDYRVPGLLVIDTPGHESFTNLRSRGSSLCDIAVLVIDIMHGLEAQTMESIELLRMRKTPFIVALNKVDRLYGWKVVNDTPIRDALAQQEDYVISEFEKRTKGVVTQLMEQGLNAAVYYENDNFQKVVSLVPTSAHSGEGIPDLLLLLVQLTQQMMVEKLMFHTEVQCTVIEVKMVAGHGTTIDVVLVNGSLKNTDTIVVAGLNGPIVTPIRALLTPYPLKEMRVKGEYMHWDEIKAAMGIKIAANGLENAIAGTSLMVAHEDDDLDEIKEAVMADYESVMGNVAVTGRGVCVQASTLGSLEALMEFLRVSEIPVAGVALGPVHRKDIMRASVMLEHKREFATILAFDVKVTKEAQEMADSLGVKLFTAEIIYHLFDQFKAYMEEVQATRRTDMALEAVFPCILRIVPTCIFMKKNPIVLGVDILEGICKVGTPIVCTERMIPDLDNPGQEKPLELGRITSIERDHKPVDMAKRGSSVCIKITPSQEQSYVQFGRHFDATNTLCSKLSRESIDLLKENFRNDLEKDDWRLVIKLKKVFDII